MLDAARRAALVLAASLALAPTAQGATAPKPRTVSLYPVLAEDLTRDEVTDLEAVLESGLHQAARREVLLPREPLRLPPTCGRSPTDECLGNAAGDGVLLLARARREGVHLMVSLSLVDGQGRRTRSASFLTTLSVQDARPCDQAISMLEFELDKPGRAGPALAVTPGPSARAERAAGPPRDTALAPRAVKLPEAIALREPEPPSRPWSSQRKAAAWTAGGGLAVAGCGALALWRGRTIEDRLTARYRSGTLAPADAADYGRMRRWGRAANGLFAAGGAAVAVGAGLWLLGPSSAPADGGVTIGVAGTFP